jgi:glyoxylase-like metal-dependent hydrolase (beta-lactamase superfamily II)
VRLDVVGPAHTGGDVIAHLPAAGIVFTGDICFHGSTPIVWAGPVTNWLAACARIRSLEPTTVVPGHGPVGDLSAIDAIERYFTWLVDEVRLRHEAGMPALDAAWDLELGEYGEWSDRERTVVNVDAVYAELDPGHERLDVVIALAEMGRYRYHR